jgi:hypothetical protein
MMLVSIVGHASLQTARGRGPSTMERSYRPPARGATTATGLSEVETLLVGTDIVRWLP